MKSSTESFSQYRQKFPRFEVRCEHSEVEAVLSSEDGGRGLGTGDAAEDRGWQRLAWLGTRPEVTLLDVRDTKIQ